MDVLVTRNTPFGHEDAMRTNTNTNVRGRVDLLEGIHRLAFADAGALVDEEGLRPIPLLSKEEAAPIVYIKMLVRSDRGRQARGKRMTRPIKIGISDKTRSLALFANVHRLLTAPVPGRALGKGARTQRARAWATEALIRLEPREEWHRGRPPGDSLLYERFTRELSAIVSGEWVIEVPGLVVVKDR